MSGKITDFKHHLSYTFGCQLRLRNGRQIPKNDIRKTEAD